jgi:hypothetical protein
LACARGALPHCVATVNHHALATGTSSRGRMNYGWRANRRQA